MLTCTQHVRTASAITHNKNTILQSENSLKEGESEYDILRERARAIISHLPKKWQVKRQLQFHKSWHATVGNTGLYNEIN